MREAEREREERRESGRKGRERTRDNQVLVNCESYTVVRWM